MAYESMYPTNFCDLHNETRILSQNTKYEISHDTLICPFFFEFQLEKIPRFS